MTRPAVNYDTGLSRPFYLYDYDAAGNLIGQQLVTGVSQWRLLNKQASVATKPGRRGTFSDPTAYFCSFGQILYVTGEMYYRPMPPYSDWRIAPDNCPTSSYGRSPTSLYSPSANLWNMLEVKALNKLRNSDVNVGVAIAEAKETEHLLTSTAKRIASTNLGLPRSVRQAAKRFCGVKPRKVPQQYLETMYGWTPLLNDLVGALESLYSNGQEGFLVQVRSSKRQSGSLATTIIHAIGSQDGLATYQADNKVVLRYKLTNALLAKLSSLGLVNPAEIVWERVPYSFVVDWFIPIGSWLSALSGDFGYTFVHGFRNTFCSFSEFGPTQDVNPGSPVYSIYRNACRWNGKYGYQRRTLYTSTPVPAPYFKSPVSAHHIAEALSLLATSFGR